MINGIIIAISLFFTSEYLTLQKKEKNKIDASGVKRLIPCMSFCS